MATATSASCRSVARAFQIGLACCIINTILGAGQPVITRWGALHLDPLLFCAGSVAFAALFTVALLLYTGELGLVVDRRYRGRLFCVALFGTVMTSLTVTYGLTRIGAVAGVLLMQTEPVYSLILSTIFVGERPSVAPDPRDGNRFGWHRIGVRRRRIIFTAVGVGDHLRDSAVLADVARDRA